MFEVVCDGEEERFAARLPAAPFAPRVRLVRTSNDAIAEAPDSDRGAFPIAAAVERGRARTVQGLGVAERGEASVGT